ncbi:CTP-dependent riboflavin kinase [Candidatus Micrarchaeota archaeon]|nr:CTP-dependent riboflavin kinase [Candidatus Micrarchaeota archaeon]
MNVNGVVVSGMRKGAKFVAMPFYSGQFKQRLGFLPFPGTLNIRMAVKDKKKITKQKGIRIAGKKGKGSAWCFAVKVNTVPCFAIIPDKSTHEKNILEILSRFNLRKKLRLRNRCRVRIAF